jgi:hypothetical protein
VKYGGMPSVGDPYDEKLLVSIPLLGPLRSSLLRCGGRPCAQWDDVDFLTRPTLRITSSAVGYRSADCQRRNIEAPSDFSYRAFARKQR